MRQYSSALFVSILAMSGAANAQISGQIERQQPKVVQNLEGRTLQLPPVLGEGHDAGRAWMTPAMYVRIREPLPDGETGSSANSDTSGPLGDFRVGPQLPPLTDWRRNDSGERAPTPTPIYYIVAINPSRSKAITVGAECYDTAGERRVVAANGISVAPLSMQFIQPAVVVQNEDRGVIPSNGMWLWCSVSATGPILAHGVDAQFESIAFTKAGE